MPTATIDAHNEDLEDGTSILFPAASVACNAGDYIVVNLGTATSYVGASGTITFGQFWNGSAWTGTGSPYTNVPVTWNMEDEAFADVEILATVDFFADPHSGEYPVHNRSGHHAIHGGHIRPKAVGRKHAHPHHPGKHHISEAIFAVVQVGGTFNTVALGATEAAITWTGGSFSNDGGGTIVNFSASGTTGAPASISGPTTWVPLRCLKGDYIVLNNSGATITTLTYNGGAITIPNGAIAAVDSVDTTQDAYIGVYIIGRVTTTNDAQTGLPWVHGWHTHAHQKAGGHIALNSVDGDVHVKKNGHIRETHIGLGEVHGGESGHTNHVAALAIDGGTSHDHIAHQSLHGGESGNADHHAPQSHHVKHMRPEHPAGHHAYGAIIHTGATNTVAGTCTVTVDAGLVLWKNNGGSWAYGAATLTNVPKGAYIVGNQSGAAIVSTDGSRSVANSSIDWMPSANDFTQSSQDNLHVLGRVSTDTDPYTGQYYTLGHQSQVHQHHGRMIAPGSIDGGASSGQSSHLSANSLSAGTHVKKDGTVALGHLKNPGSGGVAVLSGQDNFSFTDSANWAMRNWGNFTATAQGALTGGPITATQAGTQFMVEVQLKSPSTSAYGNYHRVYRMFLQQNPSSSGVPVEAQITSDDGQWTLFVNRFDIFTDGTAESVIGYIGNMSIGTNISAGIQFRILWAIQS